MNESIEDKVLDSELFLREMKQYMISSNNKAEKQKFNKNLGKRVDDGHPIEIIDGDAEFIERDSLTEVLKWV